jgi:anti-sigma regulatory factor (Ser/Thr protein kinase)
MSSARFRCWRSSLIGIEAAVSDSRTNINSALSPLRSHEAMGMLGAQQVMVQVSYPLSARNRHIQIFYAILDMH